MNNIITNKDGLKLPYCCIIPANVERKDWCGSGKIGTWLVPDYLFGISIKKAGFIHDYMYDHQFNKKLSDKVFLHNMKQLIKNWYGSKAIKDNANIIAYYYYQAVNWFGYFAYNRAKKEYNINKKR